MWKLICSAKPVTPARLDVDINLQLTLREFRMSKWASTPQEIGRISEAAKKLIGFSLVLIILESGEKIEGVIRNLSTGNNASTVRTDGRWLYYGNFDLETLEGQSINIDMISVRSVVNIWAEKSSVYAKAGLINIAG